METLSQTNKQMLTTSTLFNISFMKQIYPQYTNIGTVWTVSADLEFCSTGSSQSLQPICLFSSQPLLCITSPLRLITHPDVLFYEELRQRGDHKKQNFKTKNPTKLILKKKLSFTFTCVSFIPKFGNKNLRWIFIILFVIIVILHCEHDSKPCVILIVAPVWLYYIKTIP